MGASHRRPREAEFASFGLALFMLLLTSTTIGLQDLGSLMAQQADVMARGRQNLLASPFGTIHAAVFRLPQPLGTALPRPPNARPAAAMPEPPRYQLASLDTRAADITGSIDIDAARRVRRNLVRPVPVETMVYPTVNRAGKGDRMVPRWGPQLPSDAVLRAELEPDARPLDKLDLQQEVLDAIAHDRAVAARPQAPANPIDEIRAAVRFQPFPEYDISLSLELYPQLPSDDRAEVALSDQPDMSIIDEATSPDATRRTARLFFGDLPLTTPGTIEPWADGEQPILMVPRGPATLDIKRAALNPNAVDPRADGEGVTVAGKGEVTGEGQRPKSPAEYLALAGEERGEAERCLTNAIYFESRGESVRGQIAVAQVVLNRVFSGYYPNDVCGVVYQNSRRHLACQFTFTCDGRSKAIHEPDAFERAQRIAKAALDGEVWLPQVGKATHYHARWVRPRWVREMHKLDRIGVHTFYRPRRWGDGAEQPSWGTPDSTEEASAKL